MDEEEDDDVFVSPVHSDKNHTESFMTKTPNRSNFTQNTNSKQTKRLRSSILTSFNENNENQDLAIRGADENIETMEDIDSGLDDTKNLPHQTFFSHLNESLQTKPFSQFNSGQLNGLELPPYASTNRLPSLQAEHLTSVRNPNSTLSPRTLKALPRSAYIDNDCSDDFKSKSGSSSSKYLGSKTSQVDPDQEELEKDLIVNAKEAKSFEIFEDKTAMESKLYKQAEEAHSESENINQKLKKGKEEIKSRFSNQVNIREKLLFLKPNSTCFF